MAAAVVRCPHCQSDAVVKYGKASNGKERFRCQQSYRCGRTFLRSYAYPGGLPTVKQQIVDMTLKVVGSGICASAGRPQHGDEGIKRGLSRVNTSVVEGCCPDATRSKAARGRRRGR